MTFHNVTLFGRHAENPALVKGAVVTISGTQKSRAYEKDGEKRNWTETTANSFGVVPIQQAQTQPRPSPQGEQWGRRTLSSTGRARVVAVSGRPPRSPDRDTRPHPSSRGSISRRSDLLEPTRNRCE